MSLIPYLLSFVFLAAGIYAACDWWFALPEGEVAQYVGGQACVECHAEETRLWTGSDHQRAMDAATAQTVLGDFGDRHFEHFGVKSRMFRRGDGTFCVETDNREGKLEVFAVKYVLGYRPLQQYLVEFADGRIQCLPLAWDTEQKRWFHLYPDEPIPHTDPLHWTRPLQNWNYMCAECHTTNLRKNYRVEDNTYHTEFSEINVGCEACHGPGSLHVKIAQRRRWFWDRRYGYGLPRLNDPDNNVVIDTCAPCHARRRIVQTGDWQGKKLLDHYLPELLDTNTYYADGQILDEVFEYSSFVQSKMYHQGVRCTDCHDPHSAVVKFGDASTHGRFRDNRLCGQCHVAAQYDVPAHHHHPDATKPGTACVDCHMPDRPYMVVDPRRDHSLRIPRPDLTVALGIPNACNGCHHDAAKGETPQWAVEKMEAWYGKKKQPPHFAFAIDAGRKGKPEAVDALREVIDRPETRAIVRATAVTLLGPYPDEGARKTIVAALDSPEGIVRAAAVRALESFAAEELPEALRARLADPLRAVRSEAARALARQSGNRFGEADRQRFQTALAEYVAAREAVADQPGAHVDLALLYDDLGQFDKAEREYRAALAIDPQFVPARINLGMFHNQRGQRARQRQDAAAAEQDQASAEREFHAAIDAIKRQLDETERQAKISETAEEARRGAGFQRAAAPGHVENVPHDQVPHVPVFATKAVAIERPLEQLAEQTRRQLGEAHYSLGLLLAENEKRLAEATEALETAAGLLPARARVRYNLGLARQKLGRLTAAEEALGAACRLAPAEPDYVQALTIFYVQQNELRKASACAEELVRLAPGNPEYRALHEFIRRSAHPAD